MSFRLAIVDASVRSTLDCGGSTPPSPSLHDHNAIPMERRRRAAAVQGASHSECSEGSECSADLFWRSAACPPGEPMPTGGETRGPKEQVRATHPQPARLQTMRRPDREDNTWRGPAKAHDSIKIHIEELVLHGFAPGDRHQIAAAVESELARLVSDRGLQRMRANSSTVGRINAGAFKLEAGAMPQAAGTEIARAVYRGVRQHARASARALRART